MKQQELLCAAGRKATATYFFIINSGGELEVSEHGTVEIEFRSNIFYSARYPFVGTYSRFWSHH